MREKRLSAGLLLFVKNICLVTTTMQSCRDGFLFRPSFHLDPASLKITKDPERSRSANQIYRSRALYKRINHASLNSLPGEPKHACSNIAMGGLSTKKNSSVGPSLPRRGAGALALSLGATAQINKSYLPLRASRVDLPNSELMG